MTEKQIAVVQKIAPHALACEVSTTAPAELIAAQCILESGWLEHASGNNCFGIKARDRFEPRQLLWTEEWFTEQELNQFLASNDGRYAKAAEGVAVSLTGRRLFKVQDWFRVFPTLEACFRERAALVTRKPYRAALEEYRADGDLEKYVRAVGAVYATAPGYAESILMVIRQIKPEMDKARAERAERKVG